MCNRGYSLTELMIALALTSMLLLGIVQLFSASRQSFSVQQSAANLSQEGRFALASLEAAVSSAGYRPDPWEMPAFTAVGAESREIGNRDQIHLIRLSDTNCFGTVNPVLDAGGKPAFYLRQEWFSLDDDRHLRWRCEYADTASPASGTVQANNLSLAEDVEQFQVLYGHDSNGDLQVDRWIRAGNWEHAMQIRAVKAGLVLSGDRQLAVAGNQVADELLLGELTLPRDGRMRRIFSATWPIWSQRP